MFSTPDGLGIYWAIHRAVIFIQRLKTPLLKLNVIQKLILCIMSVFVLERGKKKIRLQSECTIHHITSNFLLLLSESNSDSFINGTFISTPTLSKTVFWFLAYLLLLLSNTESFIKIHF